MGQCFLDFHAVNSSCIHVYPMIVTSNVLDSPESEKVSPLPSLTPSSYVGTFPRLEIDKSTVTVFIV